MTRTEFNIYLSELLVLLIPALMEIDNPEGDPTKVGVDGDSVGVLQIRPIMVEDVNRIVRVSAVDTDMFSLEDRNDPELSRGMAELFFHHYAWHYYQATRELPTLEMMARMWNAGPGQAMNGNVSRDYVERVMNLVEANKRQQTKTGAINE